MAKPVKDPLTGAETTGHVWDDNLQEFNNPLPRWWIWTFYATVIFSVVYWVVYPSWPVADDYTKGVGSVTYQTPEGEKTTHWNMRSLFLNEMQSGEQSLKQKEYLDKVAAASQEEIANDADMSAFVRSYGKGIFGDNCAACHQTGGQGVVGLFPNLVDDDWLWGSEANRIEETIRNGRLGYMPPFKETLNNDQVTQVAHYVLSLSGEEANPELAVKGEKLFNGEETGCYYCHTSAGTGMHSQGAANLTDKVWTIANLPKAESPEAKLEAIKAVISNGVMREMPNFGERLGDKEIKVLVAYLKQMAAEQ